MYSCHATTNGEGVPKAVVEKAFCSIGTNADLIVVVDFLRARSSHAPTETVFSVLRRFTTLLSRRSSLRDLEDNGNCVHEPRKFSRLLVMPTTSDASTINPAGTKVPSLTELINFRLRSASDIGKNAIPGFRGI